MLACFVAPGTEPTPGARAQEAACLVSQFIGDLCVVALVQGFHIGRPRPVEELR
jgi:hypothetical protein